MLTSRGGAGAIPELSIHFLLIQTLAPHTSKLFSCTNLFFLSFWDASEHNWFLRLCSSVFTLFFSLFFRLDHF